MVKETRSGELANARSRRSPVAKPSSLLLQPILTPVDYSINHYEEDDDDDDEEDGERERRRRRGGGGGRREEGRREEPGRRPGRSKANPAPDQPNRFSPEEFFLLKHRRFFVEDEWRHFHRDLKPQFSMIKQTLLNSKKSKEEETTIGSSRLADAAGLRAFFGSSVAAAVVDDNVCREKPKRRRKEEDVRCLKTRDLRDASDCCKTFGFPGEAGGCVRAREKPTPGRADKSRPLWQGVKDKIRGTRTDDGGGCLKQRTEAPPVAERLPGCPRWESLVGRSSVSERRQPSSPTPNRFKAAAAPKRWERTFRRVQKTFSCFPNEKSGRR